MPENAQPPREEEMRRAIEAWNAGDFDAWLAEAHADFEYRPGIIVGPAEGEPIVYRSRDELRRFFDEWRGLREVYGHVEPVRARQVIGRIRQETVRDREYLRNRRGASGTALALGTLESIRYQSFRALGSIAGSRADRLPESVRKLLSLERHGGFESQVRHRT